MSGMIEGWRWAELIQDFTLFPIRPGPQSPTIRRTGGCCE